MHLNEPASDFELLDIHGVSHTLRGYRGKIVIINFWSAECPHSERADHQLLGWLETWNGEVVLLSVASNRNESIQMLTEAAESRNLPYVLLDSNQSVADLYEAVTTPHVFVIDREGILRYRGAVDDVTFRQREATRFFLWESVTALLHRRLPALDETPAYGCTIVREI